MIFVRLFWAGPRFPAIGPPALGFDPVLIAVFGRCGYGSLDFMLMVDLKLINVKKFSRKLPFFYQTLIFHLFWGSFCHHLSQLCLFWQAPLNSELTLLSWGKVESDWMNQFYHVLSKIIWNSFNIFWIIMQKILILCCSSQFFLWSHHRKVKK